MDKEQFEEIIPEVKKIIKMAKKAREKEEAEETNLFGANKDPKEILEELYGKDNPRVQLTNYLTDFDYHELKIIQSFMLTGREISQSPTEVDFDKETIEEIFDEFLKRSSHLGDKNALIGYMTGKIQLDEYLSKGIKNFEIINQKSGVTIEDEEILIHFIKDKLEKPTLIDDYEVYRYEHIDFLNFMPEVEESIKSWDGSDKLISKVENKLKENGWEGDGTLRFLWLPPFVFNDSGTWGTLIWVVKQQNNGTSFLCSPRPLPFENLRKW